MPRWVHPTLSDQREDEATRLDPRQRHRHRLPVGFPVRAARRHHLSLSTKPSRLVAEPRLRNRHPQSFRSLEKLPSRMYNDRKRRPSGISPQDYANFESMVLIATKHDLEPKRLIDAFFQALDTKTAHCGKLTISCRAITQDSATFLITNEGEVIWQFPVNLEIIENPEFRRTIQDITITNTVKSDQSGKNLKINELRVGIKGVNVKAQITEIPPAKRVFTKWGSEAFVSNIKIADETGSIRLSLWNDQINLFHIGDEVEITNCNVASFAEKPQLRLGRKGTISLINQVQRESIQHAVPIPTQTYKRNT